MKKEKININPVVFCGLLDKLVDNFFKKGSAQCTNRDDFAGQLTAEAQEFFSITIHQAEFSKLQTDSREFDVIAVLSDDTKYHYGKNTYTFVIFFNSENFHGEAKKINIATLLAHEICHFAFYYELFLRLGGNIGSSVYDKFKHIIFGSFPERLGASVSLSNSDKHKFSDHIVIMEIISFLKKNIRMSILLIKL